MVAAFPATSFRHRNDLSGVVFTVPRMTTVFSSVQAGHHLGLSDRTIRNMIGRGEIVALSVDPVRIDAAHVADVLRLRQLRALNKLELQRRTPVWLALDTRQQLLRPDAGVVLPHERAEDQRRRLGLLPDAAKSWFGTAALNAVFWEDGCRWCKCVEYAGALGGLWAPLAYSREFHVLFDMEPCTVCGPALYQAAMEACRVQVHGTAVRPSGPAPRASEAERQAAAEWARRHAPAPATPVQGDDGKALISRRLREVRGSLKDARRRGDTRYAMALQSQLQSLTADASAVDGATKRSSR